MNEIRTCLRDIKHIAEHLEALIADLDDRIACINALPHANANVWARPGTGKNADDPDATAYYLVYSASDPRRQRGGQRRIRIGKGEGAKLQTETMIERYQLLQLLTNIKKEAETKHIRIRNLLRSLTYTGTARLPPPHSRWEELTPLERAEPAAVKRFNSE